MLKSKEGVEKGEVGFYLKALSLKSLEDVKSIKEDVSNRFIVILRITPLANKDVGQLKEAVEELYQFITAIGGDIARLGEERIVLTPPGVKIWRGLV